MTSYTDTMLDRALLGWPPEPCEPPDARVPTVVLAGMSSAALRALVLHHAAEEPCERRAPDAWQAWCGEFDRLALAFAEARRAGR